jgi:hypothetical protein
MLNNLLKSALAATQTGDNGPAATGTITINNPLQVNNIQDLISGVAHYLAFYIAPAIVVIMVLYGAFQILTAGGAPEKIATGRKTILYAVIGYAVVLIAAGIVAVIQDLIGVKGG